MTRSWLRRLAVLSVISAVAFALLRTVDRDPEPVRLTILCVLVVMGLWVVQDLMSSTTPSPGFVSAAAVATAGTGVDPRTDALARLVDGHLRSRRPDRQLHARLVELADQRLAHRHGVRLAEQPDLARELLGAEAFDRLHRPPRRFSPTDIESVLIRIEEL